MDSQPKQISTYAVINLESSVKIVSRSRKSTSRYILDRGVKILTFFLITIHRQNTAHLDQIVDPRSTTLWGQGWRGTINLGLATKYHELELIFKGPSHLSGWTYK